MPRAPQGPLRIRGVLDQKEAVAPLGALSILPRTDPQYLARARLHLLMKEDATVRPDLMTLQELSDLIGTPELRSWAEQDPSFISWFVTPTEIAEKLEATYHAFIDALLIRKNHMMDGDFLKALKLVAEIADKMPSKFKDVRVMDAEVARMTGDEQVKLVVDSLRKMGYHVTGPGESTPLPAKE